MLAVPLAILGNVMRLIIIIITADKYGEAAGKAIEQKLGFLTFAVAIVVMMGLGYFLRETDSNGNPPSNSDPLPATT